MTERDITGDREISKVRKSVDAMRRDARDIQGKNEDCRSLLKDVKNIYYYQENMFKKRLIFLATLAFIFFILGNTFANRKNMDRASKKLERASKWIKKWLSQCDLSDTKIFLITGIVALIIWNLTLLQAGSFKQYEYAIVLSLISVSFAFLCSFLRFSRPAKGKHTLDITILISMTLGILFFPIVWVFISNLFLMFFILVKTILVMLWSILTGSP